MDKVSNNIFSHLLAQVIVQTGFGWIIISIENTWSIEGEFFPICVLYKNRKQKQVLRRMCMKQDKKREAEQYIIFGIRFRPGHCHVWYRNIWYDFKQN